MNELAAMKAMQDDWPLVDNPHLQPDEPVVEQLVQCICGALYRVLVNGEAPISDREMEGIACPQCGRPASQNVMIFGHSGGRWNACIQSIIY